MGWKERGDPPVPSAMGISRPGLGGPTAAVRTVGGPPAHGHGRLDLSALRTAVRTHEGGAEGRSARPFPQECGERARVPRERRLCKTALCLYARRVGGRPARGLTHPPARSRPAGVPSGSAVPWAQTHRAEALQRVPRATQAGEAVPPTHRPCPTLGGGCTSCGPRLCHPLITPFLGGSGPGH